MCSVSVSNFANISWGSHGAAAISPCQGSRIWNLNYRINLIFFIFIPKKNPELSSCMNFLPWIPSSCNEGATSIWPLRQASKCGPRLHLLPLSRLAHTHTHQDAPHAGQCPASSVSECHWQQELQSVMNELFPSFSSWEANNEATLRGQQSFF